MRKILAAMIAGSLCSLLIVVTSLAQVNPEKDAKPVQSQGQSQQPQGNPGNLETKPGQAPASSPQGETPGGMQSNPQGSTKSTTGKSDEKK